MSCARPCSTRCRPMAADRAVQAGPGRAGSRPLYAEIADAGSLTRFGEAIEAANPSDWPGYPDQLRRARTATGARHAVTTGTATVGGQACVLVGFEFPFLGGSMGTAEGARIVRAFSVAVAERLPIVCVSASGGSRMQEGTSALLQMQAVATAIAGARRAGIPHIAVAGDPTTGGVWSSLIADADVLISVPGARVSFSGSRTRPRGADPRSSDYLADGKWVNGFVDVLAPVPELRAEVAAAVRLLSPRSRGDGPGHAPLPPWPAPDGDGDGPPDTDAWTHVSGARAARVGPARTGGWRGTSSRPQRSAAIAAGAWIPACAAGSAATEAPRSRTSRRPACRALRPGTEPRPACSGWRRASGCRPHADRHPGRGGRPGR